MCDECRHGNNKFAGGIQKTSRAFRLSQRLPYTVIKFLEMEKAAARYRILCVEGCHCVLDQNEKRLYTNMSQRAPAHSSRTSLE